MRRIINILAFTWLALGTLAPEFFQEFYTDVNQSFNELFTDTFPFFNQYFSFDSLMLLLLLFNLVTDTQHFQRGATRLIGLALRRYSFLESNQVLSLNSRSQVGEKVEVDDFVKDICYIERRFNSWLLILLMLVIVLVPGIILAITSEQALYVLPFVFVAVILFFSMLRGVLSVTTGDGGTTIAATTKSYAIQLADSLTDLYPGEFTRLSLSNIFSDREVLIHSRQVTGVVQVSQFPWGCLFLFLLSLAGAYFVIKDEPDYTLRVIIIPVILLLLVIFLALQKRLMIKMIGAHYYAVGNRSSAREVLDAAAQKITSPLEPVVQPWTAPAPQPIPAEPANIPSSYTRVDQPVVDDLFPQPKPVMKTCPSCGKENSADHIYCVYCGATL